MADGDLSIVLPPQQRTIQRNETGMATRLGPPLRGPVPPIVPMMPGDGQAPEVMIDVGPDDGPRIIVGDDGSISMGLPAPAVQGTGTQDQSDDFGENLAETLPEATLSGIASEIIEGVEADITSRSQWIEQYTKGIDLLALRLEEPGTQGGGQRGVSRAGETLLMEAMVKYQAGAEAELLPAAGPAKVETVGQASEDEESRAQDFEADFNYLLTEVMKEYYPDTASMLMHQAYCGIGYKKVYRHPIRQRPVSESVLAPDLIVSEEATDLDTALRVTHSIQMLKGALRRMQLVGHYREIDLGMPTGQYGIGRQAQIAINRSQGIASTSQRPQDQPYEIWETDTELDLDFLGIVGKFENKAPWGLPLPYKITVDHQSRQVLGVWRNWRPGDPLYRRRNMYVKYGMIPGLGYHSWGFLQLLGNQTRNLRSILRIMIDAGMYSNYPAGVKLKGTRTATNDIAPRPGEFADIEYSGGASDPDIRRLLMAFPFKGPDPAFIQLREAIKQDAMRLAGTVMLEVGEGRTNMPAGTILAMIEQQVQVMAGVYKRNHQSQKEELRKIRELYAENPDDLNRLTRGRPQTADGQPRIWQLAEEFMDLNLVPASDPNIPSRVHQLLVANAEVMIGQAAQAGGVLVDGHQIISDAFRAIGKDPSKLVPPPPPQGPPPPDPKVQAAAIQAEAKQQTNQAQIAMKEASLQVEREHLALQGAKAAADNRTDMVVAHTKAASDAAAPYHEAAAQPLGPPIP